MFDVLLELLASESNASTDAIEKELEGLEQEASNIMRNSRQKRLKCIAFFNSSDGI